MGGPLKFISILLALWILQPVSAHAHRYGTPTWEAKFLNCADCWGLPNANRTKTVPAADRYLVENCAKEASRRQTIKVNYYDSELCKIDIYGNEHDHGTDVLYWLQKASDNSIRVKLKLHFEITKDGKTPVTKDRAHEMLENVRACVPLLQNIWARYNIDMQILTDSDFEPSLKGEFLTISLQDRVKRSNADHYYYGGLKEHSLESQRQDDFCSTMAHETGHALGFNDEYKDDECPSRPFISPEEVAPFSIMAHHWRGWSELEFYPRHVAALVAPLCGWNDFE